MMKASYRNLAAAMGVAVGCLTARAASASVITLSSTGTTSYSYDLYNASSTPPSDPNATFNNVQNAYVNPNGGEYVPSYGGATSTVEYDLSVSGFSSLNVSQYAAIFGSSSSNPGASIVGTASVDGGAAAPFLVVGDSTAGATGQYGYTTESIPLPSSAVHSVKILYTITDNNNSQFGNYSDSLMRSQPGDVGDNPTVFAGVVTPEPASFGLLGVGSVGLLARRRRVI